MTINSSSESSDVEELYGLEKAVETSWVTLINKKPEEVIENTLCILGETSRTYVLRFLGEDYIINPDEKNITLNSGEPFFNLFKIGIMLHYMTHAKNKPLAGKLISFRELWGGNEYFYAFNNRVLKPLINYFADKPEQLLKAGQALGGEEVYKGEYGITIHALPRVPLTILFWSGDDEVEASANILFDASANEQMETEAIVWLSIATVGELIKVI